MYDESFINDPILGERLRGMEMMARGESISLYKKIISEIYKK